MKTYTITFSKSDASTIVKADNKKEAAQIGNLHKRMQGYKGRILITENN
jgi:hypothetical protein